jgi:cysteine desulfurase
MTTTSIYLDYAATTPCDPAVVACMVAHLGTDGVFANPASRSHRPGWQAEQAVETARGQLVGLLAADPREIVWTSGATEANNLAIKGVCEFYPERGRHLVTSVTEHKAVLDVMKYQASAKGYEVTFLQPGRNGRITADQVAEVLRDDTLLVSLMWVNNETGVCNDIDGIAKITRARGVLLHVDAAQALGKMPLDMAHTAVDLLSLSAHKLYGPKGIGALYVRRDPFVGVMQQIHGGGHEKGRRSGTLATHQIAGFGLAARIAGERLAADHEHLAMLRRRFLAIVQQSGLATVNGDPDCHVPGILNLSFSGVEAETLMSALPELALSSGSACNSATVEPSHVLTGMGVPRCEALGAVRVSFGRDTTLEQAEIAAKRIVEVARKLKR